MDPEAYGYEYAFNISLKLGPMLATVSQPAGAIIRALEADMSTYIQPNAISVTTTLRINVKSKGVLTQRQFDIVAAALLQDMGRIYPGSNPVVTAVVYLKAEDSKLVTEVGTNEKSGPLPILPGTGEGKS
jgi:hypothetical protein